MFQDDIFIDNSALSRINDFHEKGSKWIISSYFHTNDGINLYGYHPPQFDKINGYLGNNGLGCPSCLSFDKNINEYFDENLIWLMDCEFYHRLFLKAGVPTVDLKPHIAIRTWNGQLTHDVNHEIKKTEYHYVLEKYRKI